MATDYPPSLEKKAVKLLPVVDCFFLQSLENLLIILMKRRRTAKSVTCARVSKKAAEVKTSGAEQDGVKTVQSVSPISGLQHLSLLDHPDPHTDPEESPTAPDLVYLHAAAIFHSTQQMSPGANTLFRYSNRSEVIISTAMDEAAQRLVYQLAFDTFKHREILEDVLIDSSFYVSQPVPDKWMSLVVVMLVDFLHRKFLPRSKSTSQEENEEMLAVREVQKCLIRHKTKLVAAMARCRIKHDLLSLDKMMSPDVQLPLHTWINTFRTSLEDAMKVLHTSGFCCVESMEQLKGRSFCLDRHCKDLLVFPYNMRRYFSRSPVLTDHSLLTQDKSRCVGPCALRPLLVEEGDVLLSGRVSALTVAHVAAVAASSDTHNTVFVCLEEAQLSQRESLLNTLDKLSCTNVKLLSESLQSVDVSDQHLQKVRVVLLMPACSLSAVRNPVDFLLLERGDPKLILDLSQGSVSPEKLQTLVRQQKKELQCAVHFPKVRAVLYSTCSMLSEENEEVLWSVLSQTQENQTNTPPFRLCVPGLIQDSEIEMNEASPFFRLKASDEHNGCFLALLVRQIEPEVIETPQEVLARAAAKGLLDDIYPKEQTKKTKRVRKSRTPAANPQRPSASQVGHSLVAEFLNRESRVTKSEASVCRQNISRPQFLKNPSLSSSCKLIKTSSSCFDEGLNNSTLYKLPVSSFAPKKPPSTRQTSTQRVFSRSSLYKASDKTSAPSEVTAVSINNHRPSESATLPVPTRLQAEVLRPATFTFPPVLLANYSCFSPSRSHISTQVMSSPAHKYLRPTKRTPALHRSHIPSRGSLTYSASFNKPWL